MGELEEISGPQFKAAIARSGLTRVAVAALLEVDRQRVHEDMQSGVGPTRLAKVHERMGIWLRDDEGNPWERFDTSALIRELEGRFRDLERRLEEISERPDADMATIGQADHDKATSQAGLDASSETDRPSRGGRAAIAPKRRHQIVNDEVSRSRADRAEGMPQEPDL
ncbi:hypothetical protein GCM10009616_40320 [Microlunatus lacustris]